MSNLSFFMHISVYLAPVIKLFWLDWFLLKLVIYFEIIVNCRARSKNKIKEHTQHTTQICSKVKTSPNPRLRFQVNTHKHLVKIEDYYCRAGVILTSVCKHLIDNSRRCCSVTVSSHMANTWCYLSVCNLTAVRLDGSQNANLLIRGDAA